MSADRSRTIDGLRGIAAMAVIVQHCLEFTPLNTANTTLPSPIAYAFSNGFNLGRFGVIVFFLISGFLIPSSIGNQPRPLVSFVIGRFFRLYPLYWLSMALALVTMFALGWKIPGLLQVIANMTMFQTLFGVENILDPYWTLLIEHFFYIFCVGVFLVGALNSPLRMRQIMFAAAGLLILLAAVLVVAPQMKYAKYLGYLMYTGSFLFAMVVGHNIRLMQTREAFHFPWVVLALFVAVFFAISVAREVTGVYTPLLSPVSFFLSAIAAPLIFLFALHWRALTSWPFEFSGKISYGLYLFHGIALWIAYEWTGKPADFAHSVLLLVLVFGITGIVATLTFNFVEEPFIAFGKTIRRSLTRRDKPGFEAVRSKGSVVQDALRPFNSAAIPSDADNHS